MKFSEDLVTLSYQINTNNLIHLSQDVLEVMSDDEEERAQRFDVNSACNDNFRQRKEHTYNKVARNMFLKLDNRSKVNNQNIISED